MSNKETGGPAFPCRLDYNNPGAGKKDFSSPGMTIRDHFAGLAMQGRLAGNMAWQERDFKPVNGLDAIENECVLAYRIADAMLKARAQ